jgi:hypothetical protein
MSRRFQWSIAGAIFGAALAFSETSRAIETTYGEDPVPNSKCYDGFINLGYGIDPIPAESPYLRWQKWRAQRGLPPRVGPFKRQIGVSPYNVPPAQIPATAPITSTPTTMTVPPSRWGEDVSTSNSKRNARTRNLPQGSHVR